MNAYVAILLAFLIGSSQALKCWDCVDCEKKLGNPDTCSENKNVCMKVVLGEHIVRRCGEEELCGLGKIERAANKAWTSVVNVFKDVDQGTDTELMYCCDDDYCNGGFQTLPSLSVILLPLAVMAMLKF